MKEYYLKMAEENIPNLIEKDIFPDVKNAVMENNDTLILDFGNHYVGYFSFYLDFVREYIDAPVRLNIKFCETKEELEDNFSSYKGSLCKSWLQEEVVNIDFPGKIRDAEKICCKVYKNNCCCISKTI